MTNIIKLNRQVLTKQQIKTVIYHLDDGNEKLDLIEMLLDRMTYAELKEILDHEKLIDQELEADQRS